MAKQFTFKEHEAQSICEMVAKLTADGYTVTIAESPVRNGDGGQHYNYIVTVNYGGNETVKNEDYKLIDALQNAYTMTP